MTDYWLTAAQIAAMRLPGLPSTTQNVNALARSRGWARPEQEHHPERNPHGVWRRRAGRGGGFEYHVAVLPSVARAAALAQLSRQSGAPDEAKSRKAVKARLSRDAAWARFEGASEARKERASRKLKALVSVADLVATGMTKDAAVRMVGADQGFSAASYYGWEPNVAGVAREDWLPYLLDHYAGRTTTAEVSAEAWQFFLSDYLRLEAPTLAESYARTLDAAEANGWGALPSAKTLKRKLDREVNRRVIVLKREGEKAHDRLFPAQERDRTVFHAMQALNYDGHKLDLFVRWPDGSVGRAILLAFQDLASGKIVGWRIDRSENADAFRLAFGDVIERYGIPEIVYSDNTMAAAAKANTGGSRFRRRYKVKDDDIIGLFPALGVDLRFTTPGHGQSKPIERAFGELSRYISKAPECAGAYTGHMPTAKPENYGSQAVDLTVLLAVCEREIVRFNARVRSSGVAQGQSSDAVFAATYETAPIRKPLASDDAIRRLWLLPVTGLQCRQPDGAIYLYDNRYWAECLVGLIGQKVAVRFDPDDLHRPIHVYRLDGSYVGAAECQQAVGFSDRDAAQATQKAKRTVKRATKDLAKAMDLLDAAEVAKRLPGVPEAPPPEARVVRPAVFGNTALKPRPAPVLAEDEDPFMDAFGAGVVSLFPKE